MGGKKLAQSTQRSQSTPGGRCSRFKMGAAGLGAVLVLLLIGVAPRTAAGPGQAKSVYLPLTINRPGFGVIPVGGGYTEVTAITHAGDDRLFIAEREGRIHIIHPDGRRSVFLDLRHRVFSDGGEFGFYDFVFHPDYANSRSPGYGFVYASFSSGRRVGSAIDVDVVVSRFHVSANSDMADPASEVILLAEPQTDQMHKGGGMDFDPRDNRLYVGLGDDFKRLVAQQPDSRKGKVLRLTVDAAPRHAGGGQQVSVPIEVFALGLRNPYRIDVDPIDDQLLIGEVGDSHWEEINQAPLSQPGLNYGWPCMEGPLMKPDFEDEPLCQNPGRFRRPVHAYPHHDGSGRCAVIGGRVYRPAHQPGDGRYVFTDLCTTEIFALGYDPDGGWPRALLGDAGDHPALTLGEDRYGQLYVGTAAESGPIYRLTIP